MDELICIRRDKTGGLSIHELTEAGRMTQARIEGEAYDGVCDGDDHWTEATPIDLEQLIVRLVGSEGNKAKADID